MEDIIVFGIFSGRRSPATPSFALPSTILSPGNGAVSQHARASGPRLRCSALRRPVLALAVAALAAAPAAAATPQIFAELGNTFGNGSTISAIRVPVRTATGAYVYKDITIYLTTDSLGDLTYATTIPGQVASAPLQTANITAGTYLDSSNTAYGWLMSGPSSIGSGVGKWEITAATGEYAWCGYPATFYTGALTAIPIAARLKAAGIVDTEYSYGIIGYGAACGGQWATGRLIGVSQTGTHVEMATFTTPAGVDQSTPYDRIELSSK
jgi:hypothetical protein